ncbi:hypothetical protein ADEAN_000675600 [Angomonas deanei]|uniref:Uncharacterized protein n=1 Tax=Angomonas deanei TaxID=59799 RepID=A0A7G2CK36_9TRYP|nr:hypothetical protein ADEAN_000675600 [Angomonas deanei]
MVKETDVFCRQYFALKDSIKADYRQVAPAYYEAALARTFRQPRLTLRNTHELQSLLGEHCCGKFKFKGSPLNSTLYVL